MPDSTTDRTSLPEGSAAVPAACARPGAERPSPAVQRTSDLVEAALLDYAYTQTPTVLGGTLVAAWILTLFLWPVVAHAHLLGWSVCLLAVTAARWLVAQAFRADDDKAEHTVGWKLRFVLGATLGGLTWGAGAVLFAQQVDFAYQVFTVFMVGGIALGAASVLPAVFPAFLITCVSALAPALVWLLLQDDSMQIAMGGMVLFFLAIVFMVGRQMHVNLVESFTLRYDNVTLFRATEQADHLLQIQSEEQRRTSEALNAIVEGTAGATGREFFRMLVSCLAKILDMEYAFVGTLEGREPRSVRTLALSARGNLADNLEYDLAGTPCEQVCARKPCLYNAAVRDHFPQDTLLDDLGVESYFGVPLCDTAGNPIGLMAVMGSDPIRQVELTQSMLSIFAARAEAELMRLASETERHRLAMAIERTAEAIFITDRHGVIHYVNAAFETMTGYGRAEIVGQQVGILRSDSHSADDFQEMHAVLSSKDVWAGHHPLRRKDGTDITVERNITFVAEEDEESSGFVSICHDVTEELAARSQMEHAQRLESLGVLAGGIAHDFNNILTAILGHAGMAAMRLDPAAAARQHLACIEESAECAADLCKQMLAYSGKGQFIIESVNLANLVDDMARLISVSISKNVNIHYHLDKDEQAIEADASQIRQIVMNLIINASEAIGDRNGDITVSTGITEVDPVQVGGMWVGDPPKAGSYAYLEVADNGCGMDEKTQKMVFDPFFTTKFTGRGLGMSAVLGIVRGHEGALLLRSKPGKGSSFKVLFPSPTYHPALHADKSCATGDWRGSGTVLVIDDEQHIRNIASMMLAELGFQVLTAEDGRQGVAVFRQNRDHIRVVLLDMTMPKMNGLECFRRIKLMNPDVKVILSSGYNEQHATKRFGQQLDGFVQKPYAMSKLRGTMQAVAPG